MPLKSENICAAIAKNIAHYRKENGDTQASLADKLKYSDKSVSKWERGEGVPDIYVLVEIAELYGITVNDLISEKTPAPHRVPRRILITLLSVGLVWLVASCAFFALNVFGNGFSSSWLVFIYALPVSFIALTVFSAVWFYLKYQALAVSGLVWSIALSVHLTLPLPDIYEIYIVAAVFQVLIVLWYLYLHKSRKHSSL